MRYFAILIVLGLIAGCGDDSSSDNTAENNKPEPKKEEPKKEEPKKDPVKNTDPTKDPEFGKAGESKMAPTYACPEDGCTFTDPAGEDKTCIKHGSTKLKELWYTCDKCSKEDVKQGKCEGCGGDLKRTLK